MADSPRRVLLVCKGNICRSPAAEAVLRTLAGRDLELRSAGTRGWHQGKPAHPIVIALAKARGHDLASHQAHQVTQDDVAWADEILAMDERTRDELAQAWPGLRIELYLGDRDVPDPYGLDLRSYEQSLDLIESGARTFIDTRMANRERLDSRPGGSRDPALKTTDRASPHGTGSKLRSSPNTRTGGRNNS